MFGCCNGNDGTLGLDSVKNYDPWILHIGYLPGILGLFDGSNRLHALSRYEDQRSEGQDRGPITSFFMFNIYDRR